MLNRISRPSISAVQSVYYAGQSQMLCQDFRNSIIPSRRNRRAYVLSAGGVSRHVAESLLVPMGIVPDYANTTNDFIEAIADTLLLSQEAWLEVAFDSEENSATPFQVFSVNDVIRTREGDLIQESSPSNPASGECQCRDSNDGRVVLPSDRMVNATLPGAYPSEVLSRVIQDLGGHNDLEVFQLGFAKMTGQGDVPRNFDFREASRIKRRRLLQDSLPIGWTAREDFRYTANREISDFYLHLRELRFLHFVASMREKAEGALREVLSLVGQRCGFTFEVTAHGINTPDEVNALIENLKRGDLSFSAIRDIVHERQASGESPQMRQVFSNKVQFWN